MRRHQVRLGRCTGSRCPGSPRPAAGIGVLLGSTRVFNAAELARRYPSGPGEYAAAFRDATAHAAAAGFVREQDVEEMVAVAAAAYPA